MKQHRQTRIDRLRPNRIECNVTGGMVPRTSPRNQQRLDAKLNRFRHQLRRPLQIGKRHVAHRQQTGVYLAERHLGPIGCRRHAAEQINIVAVFEFFQPDVGGCGKHQLAGNADVIKSLHPVFTTERT